MIEWALVGVLTSALVVWLSLAAVTIRPDNMIYDAWMRLRAGPTSEQIVIVAIDNRSLEALGRWPWSRQTHAELIDRLAQARPRAVGYDVLFVEPSASGDADLARAIHAAGNVYLPMLVDPVGENGAPWQATEPIPDLRDAAAGLGHVNLVVDADGVVRRMPLYLSASQRSWPHMAEQLARTLNAAGETVSPFHDGVVRSTRDAALDQTLSADQLTGKGSILVSYRGPPGQFRTVSFVDLLRGETPAAFLKDKLVLVGMTGDGQGDRYATPTTGEGQLMPGVEIQASLLDTLLHKDALAPVGPIWTALLSLIPLWLLMAGLLLFRPLWSLVAGAGLMVVVVTISAAAFWFGVWFPPVAALAGLALAYPLWSWRRLAAASSYMQVEVDAFARSGPVTPPAVVTLAGGDVVARQVETLRTAVSGLRDLERFISDALHSLPDATLVVSEAGEVVMANAQAKTLFGRDDLVGAPLTPLLKAIGGQGGEGQNTERQGEAAEITTPTGRQVFVSSAPLVDAEGAANGRIVRLADMTEFRLTERQREQALQLLSHDMRAPQVSILTLLSGTHDRTDPEFERRIADNARLTLTLAEGYVQLARAESQVLGDAVFDLSQVLLDAADTLWPQASQKGVRIEAESHDDAEYLVRGDQGLITRVLMNLIDNAIKFSPVDSIVDCTVVAGDHAGAPVWVCTIRDHGEGLSAETQRRLFEPFSKGETDRPGAGLGLAFARAVVERHGGDIRCESTPGEGAAFIVRLPLAVETV